MNKQLRQELDELLYLMLEDTATPAQVNRLNALIKSDTAVCQYITDYYFIAAALRKGNSIVSSSLGTQHEVSELQNLLIQMAQEEKTAPPGFEEADSKQDSQAGPTRKATVEKPTHKINRFSLVTSIISLAALLILIAYVHIVPPKQPVAILKDSIGAQWYSEKEGIEIGSSFYNSDCLRTLKKGILEIEFDYGATVVIEGPSEFVCKSDNQIVLSYGRLYARVPSSATGFTVETKKSRIVDIGTEFGVLANFDGSVELHVTKGITKLLFGSEKNKETITVKEGQSREVSPDGKSVKAIFTRENQFVRQINSKTGLARKGQHQVDLADIVGGGNGFGTGRRNIGINPATGEISDINTSDLNRKSNNTYRKIDTIAFVDGVFVPNGQTKQIISSDGHVFSECPITQGNFYTEISNAPTVIDRAEIVLGGVNYSREGINSLFMHANLGITYDLQAIRSQLADVRITRFRSTIGISETSWRPCNADFWILVDGQLRYRRGKVQQKGIIDTIEIELSENDRFLTLVTTDGGDPEANSFNGGVVTSMDSDWCVFANPVLIFE